MDAVAAVIVGGALALVGAVGATLTQRRLDAEGRSRVAPLYLTPFGVLIGAGAAVARGWDVTAAIVVGAIVIPLVGVVGRLLEVRRHRRSAQRSVDP